MPKEGERERMKKKLFSLIFAASISMALLAGCGGGQETATGTGIKAEGGTEAMPAARQECFTLMEDLQSSLKPLG